MAEWIFPSTNGGEKQGLNNTGIEQFKDNSIASLARELCQNSLDAGEKSPVIVEFKTFSLNRKDFPNSQQFSDILNNCRDFKKDNKTAKDFFDQAIKIFNKEQISFLEWTCSVSNFCEIRQALELKQKSQHNKSILYSKKPYLFFFSKH